MGPAGARAGHLRLGAALRDSRKHPMKPIVNVATALQDHAPGAYAVWVPWAGVILLIVLGIGLYHGRATQEFATRWYGSSLMGSIFALLALFAGSVAEFKNSDILAAPPLRYTESAPVSAPVVFWASVVLLGAIGVAYYSAVERQRAIEIRASQDATERVRTDANTARVESRRAEVEARKHTEQLIAQLRTLPPEGFMRDFPRLSADMLAPYSRALVSRQPDDIAGAIRYALRAAALMAFRFGRTSPSVVYTANAMRFYSAERLGPMSTWTEDELRLYPRGFRGDAISGALVFDPAQSTTHASPNAAPLTGVGALRIIIPDPPRDRPRGTEALGNLRVLPGCATAFATGKPFIAHDCWDMRHSLDRHDVPEEVVAASDHYLRSGAAGSLRSFVSLPMRGPQDGDPIVGVLNVEVTIPNILGGDDATVEHFALAVAPVCFVIEMLWRLQDDVGGAPPGTSAHEAAAL